MGTVILKALGAVPGWLYAALLGLVIVLAVAFHLIGQRNDARDERDKAQAEVGRLVRDNATLAGNVATLTKSLEVQGKSIKDAADESARAQAQAAADLKLATQRARDAEAKNKAMQAIQASGDRTKGGDYAHDIRRARLLRP